MFLLGLLSILQAGFLPGFLVTYGLNLCHGRVRIITCSFCLSALFNFFMVHFCLLFSIYTQITMFFIIGGEIILLLYLLHRGGVLHRLVRPDQVSKQLELPCVFAPRTVSGLKDLPESRTAPYELFGVIAVATIAFSFSEVLFRLGDTFSIADAIESWNLWGVQMAGNLWPNNTQMYPQLVPANYSITYVLTGGVSVWFFGKAWISLFFPVLLLSTYQIYREESRGEFALAVPFTLILCYCIMSRHSVYGGIVDIALSVFACNAVYAIHRAGPRSSIEVCRKELTLGALFTIAVALTKQGGLYLLFLYPVLVWILTGPGADPTRKRFVKQFIGYSTVILLLATLPWYAVAFFNAMGGDWKATHLNTLLFKLHAGRSLGERLLHALKLIVSLISWWGVGLLSVLTLASLHIRHHRDIVLLITLPYCLFWALGFSYDHRNIAMALPFLALAAAAGLGVIWVWLKSIIALVPGVFPTQKRLLVVVGVIGCIGVLTALNVYFSRGRLEGIHDKRLLDAVSVPTLNHRLNFFFQENNQPGQVLTTYKSMRWIPSLEKRYYPMMLHRYTPLTTYMDMLKKDEVRFVLLDRLKMLPEVARYFERALSTGEFEQVFELQRRFIFCRKLRKPQTQNGPVVRFDKAESPK